MIMVNIAEAKAKLSELLDAAGRGEQVMICNHNRPVAELRPVAGVVTRPRDLSPLYPGMTFMTEAFGEPMSEAEIEEWEGGAVLPRTRVAEAQRAYGKPPKKRGGRRK